MFDKHVRAFVHASCATIQKSIVQARRQRRERRTAVATIPDGIKAGTKRTYENEWRRYVSFAEKVTASIPGRDRPWDAMLLWAYMAARAKSCRPATVTSHLSALAYFGISNGFVLPTSKYDGNPILHHQIGRMKRQLSIDTPTENGARYTPERCTALGNGAVALLLSAFRVYDRAHFRRLPRSVRHHLCACVMSHTCGMRFGHFLCRKYTRASFLTDPSDNTLRLVTD